MELSNAQFKQLKSVEPYLKTAFYSQYVRTPLIKQREMVFDIYQEITSKKPGNLSCGQCILDIFSFIGGLYFKKLSENPTEEKKTTSRKGRNNKSISSKTKE